MVNRRLQHDSFCTTRTLLLIRASHSTGIRFFSPAGKLRASIAALLATLLFTASIRAVTPSYSSDKQNPSFKIPAVKIPVKVKDQTIIITASAVLSMVRHDHELYMFDMELIADLGELQRNLTPLLAAELNKDEPCRQRITIQHATLIPSEPAAIATVELHFEQWVCAKLFGKEQVKKLVSGNATIPLKLTPAIDKDATELHLVPELGQIEADGSLGQLLKSDLLGDSIRDKIHDAMQTALQKGANLGATLPPAAQPYATLQTASFKDSGSGSLIAVLDGQVRVTNEQLQQLEKELKERASKHESSLWLFISPGLARDQWPIVDAKISAGTP